MDLRGEIEQRSRRSLTVTRHEGCLIIRSGVNKRACECFLQGVPGFAGPLLGRSAVSCGCSPSASHAVTLARLRWDSGDRQSTRCGTFNVGMAHNSFF